MMRGTAGLTHNAASMCRYPFLRAKATAFATSPGSDFQVPGHIIYVIEGAATSSKSMPLTEADSGNEGARIELEVSGRSHVAVVL